MGALPTKCDFCEKDAVILLTLQSGAVICRQCRREEYIGNDTLPADAQAAQTVRATINNIETKQKELWK